MEFNWNSVSFFVFFEGRLDFELYGLRFFEGRGNWPSLIPLDFELYGFDPMDQGRPTPKRIPNPFNSAKIF